MSRTYELTDVYFEKPRPKGGQIGYCYKLKEGDPKSLVPDWDAINLLEQALDSIDDGASYRTAADWLVEQSGKKYSFMGIMKAWKALRDSPENPRTQKMDQFKEAKRPKTKQQLKRKTLNKKIGAAKLRKINAEKRIQRLEAEAGLKKEVEAQAFVEYDIDTSEYDDVEEVLFKPNKGPQTAFLAAPELEVLYGGAAGGGKSFAMIADPLRYFGMGGFNGILVRRTNDELRELVWKSQELYPRAYPGAKWSDRKSLWTFPSGAQLWMTYLEQDKDVQRYQGQAFTWIGFDELTQYATPFAWNYMRSRLRSASNTEGERVPLCMRATTNPGGPGHGWVKRMFVDPAVPGTAFGATDIETGELLVYPKGHAKEGKPLFQRKFIPAKVQDNPYLWEDGQYEANLLSLPEDQRRQLLEGDWSVAAGAAFSEFRTHIHVVESRFLPHDWRRFRSCDFGYSSHSAVHWFAIEPQTETLIVYRELYTSKLTARDLAKKILELEHGEGVQYGVLDSSCWHVRGNTGPTIAEEMISEGCRWRPSDRTQGARVAGKNRLHERLKVDPISGRAGIEFFDTCRQIIADLPVIPSDPDGGEDIDDRYQSDHAYDSIRYGIMTRPRAGNIWDSGDNNNNGKPIMAYQPSSSIFGY